VQAKYCCKWSATSTLKKYDEGVMKIAVMERTLECVFRNLMEYFGDKIDLLDYLEEEVRNPPHTYIAGLKEQIDGLKEANSQLEI